MSRTRDAVLTELLAIDPPGFVLSKEPDSDWGKILSAMAGGVADVEVEAEQLSSEIDPRTATWMLEDFERLLGPDPCGRDELITTMAERRLIAYQRLTARGGQSVSYFLALAASLGVVATIDTDIATTAGCECGDEVIESPEQFVWRINLPATQEFEPEVGGMDAGDYLGWLVPSLVECVIRRYAPAHTIPVIAYT